MKKHIIICDHIHESGLRLLETQADIVVEDLAGLAKPDLLTHLHKADVIITRSSTAINERLLELACSGRLKAIVRAGVGVDNVDIEACSYRGVVVMNVPTANTIAAVELTMTHILSAVRRLPHAHKQLQEERKWKREDWYGTELKDKKLGVIGFGNIGSRVAIRARAFDMQVITYDPYISPHKALDLGVEYTTCFEDILNCDIITIHTPKNKQTINMITCNEIAKMKDGVILINCARGGLYNEDDLYEGLKSGKIAWAGIDVFNDEPAITNKLLDLNNIYVTPHIGANTLESQEKIAIEAANAAISAARGSAFPNALNLPTKTQDIPEFILSYLELTQKLAYFASQVVSGAMSSVYVHIDGQELEDYKDAFLTFALVGTLKYSLDDKINYINAHFVAKETNVKSHIEIQHGSSQYKNRIKITLNTEKESVVVSGVVYDDNIMRLSSINGFDLDVEPKGSMILVRNADVPGVIGSIGSMIAKHQVNIADFRLGRRGGVHGGIPEALALILVDDFVSSQLLCDLRAIPECISVRSVLM